MTQDRKIKGSLKGEEVIGISLIFNESIIDWGALLFDRSPSLNPFAFWTFLEYILVSILRKAAACGIRAV